tara:strand:- start:508 stop:1632 length:1125 start_codon:yes stop_codon:yes gene_type:complete
MGLATTNDKWQREISMMLHRHEFESLMSDDQRTSNVLKAKIREAGMPGGSTLATMVPSHAELTIPNQPFISFLCFKYAIADPALRIDGQMGTVSATCPLFSKAGNNCGCRLNDEHMRHCKTVWPGPSIVHDCIVSWLESTVAKVCGACISELKHDIAGTIKRPYDVLGAPKHGLKKRAFDVAVIDCATEARSRATHKSVLPPMRAAEQRKFKDFNVYAARAHSIKANEYAPFVVNGAGAVGESANSVMHMLARAAVPGADKDSAIRLKRSMWVSQARKELMASMVKAHHYAVVQKARLIQGALFLERHVGAGSPKGVPAHIHRDALPEELSAFGPMDLNGEEGLNLDRDGPRIVKLPPGMPPASPPSPGHAASP